MIDACNNTHHPDYLVLGGMGVTVCIDWRNDFSEFCDWSLMHGYSKNLWLVRVNLDDPYSPENCAWVSGRMYKRYLQLCHGYTAFGETKRLERWLADPRCVIRAETFRRRIQTGWPVERTLTEPLAPAPERSSYTTTTIPLGTVFSRLTVIGTVDRVRGPGMTRTAYYYTCRCICGVERQVMAQSLLKGTTRSCGCLQRDTMRRLSTIHGESTGEHFSRLYQTWLHLNNDCLPSNRQRHYRTPGERGITLCHAWLDNFGSFRDWALTHDYSDEMYLQRHDIRGEYSPDNCYWSTEQLNQRQNMQDAHAPRTVQVTAFGETKRLMAWAADPRCMVSKSALALRIRQGWTPEYAISNPVGTPSEKRLHTAFGVRKSLNEWANDSRCVVSLSVLESRVQSQHWPVERALITPLGTGQPEHNLTIFGETKQISDWGRDPRCVVSARTLGLRVRNGWDAERALTTVSQGPTQPRHLSAWGETHTLAEWAKDSRCLVTKAQLTDRINHGWDLATAITTPAQAPKPSRVLTAFQETKSQSLGARDPRCMVPLATLRGRLARGWDIEKALTTPADDCSPRLLTAFGETRTLADWARDPRCVVSHALLTNRIHDKWDPEIALTTPTHVSRTDKPA